ncbi:MAG: heparinase II/III family protein [Acidobacteria bacterium]|nr:heparinase II/III family protein [Acidobacteriota bacterium]
MRSFLLAAVLAGAVQAQPRLLMNDSDLERIRTLSENETWAAQIESPLLRQAETWPQWHLDRFGLKELELPPEGGQWTHHYVCPVHGVRLRYTPPNTHRCPVDGGTFSGWPYDEVVFTNRHSELAGAARDLGIAFRLTGRREYAERAAWILKQYAGRYAGYALHDTQGRSARSAAKVLSQTLDESIWLISIAWAYDLLSGSDVLTPEDRERIEGDLLRASVDTILRNDAGISNWQSWHNAGIAAVGFTLGDQELIERAIEGKSGFRFQMANSILDGGFWYEGAWGYHWYALDALVQTAEMAARSGIDLWGSEPNLKAMFTVPLRLAFADGSLPAFNDSNVSSLYSQDRLYEVAYARTGDALLATVLGKRARGRNALFWGAAELPAAEAPPLASELFESAGYAVLRSPAGDHAAIMKFGPHGGGHGHYDKLGLVSFARGGMLAVDPGTQPYAAPTHNTWDKMTVAHNTMVADERRQDAAAGRLLWWQADGRISAVSADAGPAYSFASLQRTLVLAPEYMLDVSEARSTDGAPHTFDWVYHNDGTAKTLLPLEEWPGLGRANGYQHLTENRAAATSDDWQLTFDGTPTSPQAYGSVYANNGNVRGRFERTTERAAGGRFSGRLTYEFSGSGYLLFSMPAPANAPGGKPVGLSIMIHGDASGHRLALRLNDATDERFVTTIGPVDWTGWRRIEAGDPEKWQHYLGNNDGVFDGPVRTAAVELTAVDGGTKSGALFVDDAVVRYDGEPFVAADFEILLRNLRVWMLGGAETTVVTGNGLGPDLLKPVRYVLARRRGTEARWAVLLEPHGGEAAVSGFRELEAGVFEISGPGFTDTVRLGPDGAGYERRQ